MQGQTDSPREGWLNFWFSQTTSDLAPSSTMVCATQLSTPSNFEFEQIQILINKIKLNLPLLSPRDEQCPYAILHTTLCLIFLESDMFISSLR